MSEPFAQVSARIMGTSSPPHRAGKDGKLGYPCELHVVWSGMARLMTAPKAGRRRGLPTSNERDQPTCHSHAYAEALTW